MFSPLEQFEITPLIYLFKGLEFLGISLTNFSFFAFVFAFLICTFSLFSIFNPKIVPSFRLFVLESIYNFVLEMITANLGAKGVKYFPFFFFLFFFILSLNLFGLFPYSFTITSSIVVASTLSFSTFIGLVIIALLRFRFNFFSLFFPTGAPVLLSFLLVPIEVVSFFSRPFSLAIRLFANMTAGHVLLKILAGFMLTVLSAITGLILTINPLAVFAFNDECLPFVFTLLNVDYVNYIVHNLPTFVPCVDSEYSSARIIELPQTYPTGTTPAHELFRLLFETSSTFRLDEAFNLPVTLYHLSQDYFLAVDLADLYIADVSKQTFILCEPTFLSLYLPTFGAFVSLDFFINLCSLLFTLVISFFSVLVPLVIIFLFILLELFVAILQAYVFSILTVIYLKDSLEFH